MIAFSIILLASTSAPDARRVAATFLHAHTRSGTGALSSLTFASRVRRSLAVSRTVSRSDAGSALPAAPEAMRTSACDGPSSDASQPPPAAAASHGAAPPASDSRTRPAASVLVLRRTFASSSSKSFRTDDALPRRPARACASARSLACSLLASICAPTLATKSAARSPGAYGVPSGHRRSSP